MRRLPVLLAAVSFAVLPAAPAAAAPPEDFDVSFTIPAGTTCDYPLRLEFSGKSKVLDRGDTVIITGPRNVAVLTNANTGTSTTLRIGGIFKDRNQGGGLTETVSTGRNLIVSRDGAVLLIGRYRFTLDEDFNLVGEYQGNGQIIDLCAQLS